jgi:hypothetical protein
MSQLKKIVEPFGEVNVRPTGGGKVRVTATILMEPHIEGAQTGIALDGSGSMAQLYGVTSGGALSPIFGQHQATNVITPVAQKVCAHLARKVDADGGTTVIYWAVGPGGGQVEEIGDFTADQVERHIFGPPRQFGTGTQLLPAVKYFEERFRSAPWGFYVFITDGELHDLDDVKQYSIRLARDVASGRRRPLKLVLVGIGGQVNERQMEELDDLETGTTIDLWDHKLASELRVVEQIFAEVVSDNVRVAERGRILDPSGRVVRDFSDTGLPAFLDFEMPASAAYFSLDVNGSLVHQGLSDTATVPASKYTPKQAPRSFDEIQEVVPVEPVNLDPNELAKPPEAAKPPGDKKDDDWLGFELKFEKDRPNVDLRNDDK